MYSDCREEEYAGGLFEGCSGDGMWTGWTGGFDVFSVGLGRSIGRLSLDVAFATFFGFDRVLVLLLFDEEDPMLKTYQELRCIGSLSWTQERNPRSVQKSKRIHNELVWIEINQSIVACSSIAIRNHVDLVLFQKKWRLLYRRQREDENLVVSFYYAFLHVCSWNNLSNQLMCPFPLVFSWFSIQSIFSSSVTCRGSFPEYTRWVYPPPILALARRMKALARCCSCTRYAPNSHILCVIAHHCCTPICPHFIDNRRQYTASQFRYHFNGHETPHRCRRNPRWCSSPNVQPKQISIHPSSNRYP